MELMPKKFHFQSASLPLEQVVVMIRSCEQFSLVPFLLSSDCELAFLTKDLWPPRDNTLETLYKALPYNVILPITYDIFGPFMCLLH